MNRSNQNYPTSPSRTNLGLFVWQLEMGPTLSLLGGRCLSIPSGRLLPLSLRRYSFPWALKIPHASSYTYQNLMHMIQTVYCQVFCLSKVMIPSTPLKKKKKRKKWSRINIVEEEEFELTSSYKLTKTTTEMEQDSIALAFYLLSVE